MSRMLPLLVALLTVAASASVRAETWTEYAVTSSFVSSYSKESIAGDERYRRVWDMTVWTSVKRLEPEDLFVSAPTPYYRSNASYLEFDCTRHTCRRLKVVYFADEKEGGEVISSFTTSPTTAKFLELMPGSVGWKLHGIVCEGVSK